MKKKRKRASNFDDLTNMQFNDLLIVEFSHVEKKQSFWKCQCVCGNLVIKRGSNVKRGLTKSCGCLKHRKLPKGFSSLNRIYKEYERGAKRRNYIFDLSLEIFESITQQNCHYCGSAPRKIKQNNCKDITRNAVKYGSYVYNGLDRVKNEFGYIQSNVVPCCYICNRAKGNLSYSEFIEYINEVKNAEKNK